MLVVVLLLMALSGCLGALSRCYIETGNREESVVLCNFSISKLISVFVLGISSALIVPLFLSIGNNSIIKDIVEGGNLASVFDKILIVMGFCVLAGATASSFIGSLAQRALSLAETNKEKIAALSQETVENRENIAEVAEASENPDLAQNLRSVPGEKIPKGDTPEERQVIEALKNDRYARRTVTGISRATGLTKSKVQHILSELIQRKLVTQSTSQKTGSHLYQLCL